jgi:hypothetical protein
VLAALGVLLRVLCQARRRSEEKLAWDLGRLWIGIVGSGFERGGGGFSSRCGFAWSDPAPFSV